MWRLTKMYMQKKKEFENIPRLFIMKIEMPDEKCNVFLKNDLVTWRQCQLFFLKICAILVKNQYIFLLINYCCDFTLFAPSSFLRCCLSALLSMIKMKFMQVILYQLIYLYIIQMMSCTHSCNIDSKLL